MQNINIQLGTNIMQNIQQDTQNIPKNLNLHLPSITELTNAEMEIFEKLYPEYPFPSHETRNQSISFQLAQTRYWKPILVKHGEPFADCLSNPETSLGLTYPRLINLFYQETDEERSYNAYQWIYWSEIFNMAYYYGHYSGPCQLQLGYKIERTHAVGLWSQFIMSRKVANDQKMQR
jgi:hypothetical protein